MKERRRWPRHPVVWSVRLFVNEHCAIWTTTIDAGPQAVRLDVKYEVAAPLLRCHDRYRFELYLPHSEATLTRLGELTLAGDDGVVLELTEPLPASLFQGRSRADARSSADRNPGRSPSDAELRKQTQLRGARSVASMLRSAGLTLRGC